MGQLQKLIAAEGTPAEIVYWRLISVFDTIVLNSRRPDEESQLTSVQRRLRAVADGDWTSLWLELQGSRRPVAAAATVPDSEKRAALVRDLLLSDETGRALKACQQRQPPVRDPSRFPEVLGLFPKSVVTDGGSWDIDPADAWNDVEFGRLEAAIMKKLRRPRRRSLPGLLGGRPEHWKPLELVDGGIEMAAHVIARLALGRVPAETLEAHRLCEVTTPTKPNNPAELRPLMLGSTLRRIGSGGVCMVAKEAVRTAVGRFQLGSAKDGCTKAYHTVLSSCRARPQHGVLARDVAAAHQHVERTWVREQVDALCPALAEPLRAWYGKPTVHFWRSSSGVSYEVRSERGFDQGDPLATPPFTPSPPSPLPRTLGQTC